jgi:hypothetical protein
MPTKSKSLYHNYHGEYASDAAVNAVATPEAGDLYYNTTDQTMRYYDATAGAWKILGLGSSNVVMTAEGGIAIRLINNTGAASVKGTLVKASNVIDNAFIVTAANEFEAIGAVYQNGVANGLPCLVVVGGIAEVLLENNLAAGRGNWARTSIVAPGRANCNIVANPGFAAQHFAEIGHCLETKVAGTNVLCKIAMHFN